MRPLHKLSAVAVASRKKPGLLGDGGGLYLRVANGGSRGWIFRFTIGGKTRDCGLGKYPTVSLVKARTAADNCRRLVASGIDPIEARQTERQAELLKNAKAKTFRECTEEYIASYEAGWRNAKHRAQWHSTMETYAFPTIGNLPVASIDTELVLTLLRRIWETKPETASRVRQRIESILNWARARGYRTGENPAVWRGQPRTPRGW